MTYRIAVIPGDGAGSIENTCREGPHRRDIGAWTSDVGDAVAARV